jgi:hypothetical protein
MIKDLVAMRLKHAGAKNKIAMHVDWISRFKKTS